MTERCESPADAGLPIPTPESRAVMKANRSRDTTPELVIRRALHRARLRYFVDRPLPFDRRRRADLVFSTERVAIFVDGCFWHGCPEHYVPPKANAAFWRNKVEVNRARDRDTDRRMADLGWQVIRIWEHESVDKELICRVRRTVVSRR